MAITCDIKQEGVRLQVWLHLYIIQQHACPARTTCMQHLAAQRNAHGTAGNVSCHNTDMVFQCQKSKTHGSTFGWQTCRVHSRMSMGVDKMAAKLKGCETGMPKSLQRPVQVRSSLSRYAPVKGPRYDMKAHAMNTSPAAPIDLFGSEH